ncbi:MAG: RagB/SusD family nutrient uptake outer membrane protein, partial [Paludibacteraceae bacterium]
KNDGDVDWPILRYADILLLYAELLNEQQGPDQALPYVNRIRERAGLLPLSIDACPNKHAMRMVIEKERRLEFAFENQRWFDLIRTDRALEVMNNHWATETYYEAVSVPILTKNLLLLPIPQREIDINPNITQNIGY